MIMRKWPPVSCQVTDPYYLQIKIFFCGQIVEHFFKKKLGARSKNWVIKTKMIFSFWKPEIRRLQLKVFLGFKSTVEKSG